MFKENSRELFFGLLIAAIAFLIYANSLGNGLTLDDHEVILDTRVLKGNALSLFTMVDAVADAQKLPFYRPLTNMTFLFDGRLHNFNTFYIRLFNVLFHSGNAFLVYLLARLLFKGDKFTPLLIGLIFAIHPLHTEGVNFNAGGRITIMACFFALASYLVHIRSALQSNIFLAYAGAILFLAGLFSKEIALMVFPLIVALEISVFRSDSTTRRWQQSCLRLAPYFAAVSVYLVMRWITLSKLGMQTSILPGIGTKTMESMFITTDFNTRMLNNLYIIPRYLLTAVWPTALCNRYVIPDDLNLLALPLFCSWSIILTALTWLLARGRSAVTLFGISWMILFWLPVSGIVFVPGAPLADRFIYIPAIGFWIIIADQIKRALPWEKPTVRRYGPVIFALVLLILAGLTVRRNLDWRSNLTLYTRFVAQYPENVHARAGLGKAYYDRGREQNTDLAEREFEKVVSMDPNFPMIFTFLGNISLNKENLNSALYNYSKAIEVYPYDKEARLNRGITLEKLGRPKEAITDYLFFLTSPGNPGDIIGGREHAQNRIKELSKLN